MEKKKSWSKICIRFGILLREVRTSNPVCSGVSKMTGGKQRDSCTFLWLLECPQSKKLIKKVYKNKSKTIILNGVEKKTYPFSPFPLSAGFDLWNGTKVESWTICQIQNK